MKTRHFKCCLCGGIKTKPGRCPECRRLPEFGPDLKRRLVQSDREARFYRGQLEAISSSERRTRAQRLANGSYAAHRMRPHQ